MKKKIKSHLAADFRYSQTLKISFQVEIEDIFLKWRFIYFCFLSLEIVFNRLLIQVLKRDQEGA